jgi:hypothetical protein
MLARIVFSLCKFIFPGKYFDDIFIAKVFTQDNLKVRNLRKTLWCFAHGFLPYEYNWYDLATNDYRNYVPTRNNYQNRSLNGAYNAILGNKLLFEKHLKATIRGIDGLHVVESIGLIEEGFLYSLNNDLLQGDFTSLIQILDKNDLVLKPLSEDGGVGVFLIRKIDDHYFINNIKAGWEEVLDRLGNLDGYLIQVKFAQRGFSNMIYSGSVNTMRIATMIDPVTHNPFIAYAVHRFGSASSVFMDNVNQGGITALINLDDGRLGKGLRCSFSEPAKEVFESHPSSSMPIFNEKVPDWVNLKNRITLMAGRMPYLKYAGWDIILSDGELFVLEGNVSPGLGLIQMFKPMSEFPEAWNFFKHYKFVE